LPCGCFALDEAAQVIEVAPVIGGAFGDQFSSQKVTMLKADGVDILSVTMLLRQVSRQSQDSLSSDVSNIF
jgi:hypothetical protein